jgi:hypothetical protein
MQNLWFNFVIVNWCFSRYRRKVKKKNFKGLIVSASGNQQNDELSRKWTINVTMSLWSCKNINFFKYRLKIDLVRLRDTEKSEFMALNSNCNLLPWKTRKKCWWMSNKIELEFTCLPHLESKWNCHRQLMVHIVRSTKNIYLKVTGKMKYNK